MDKLRRMFDRGNRVLNIHHKDLDGVASSIPIYNYFENVSFKPVKYGDVDDMLSKVDFDDYDMVLLTDVSPENEFSFDLSDKIVLLDHHDSAKKYHCPKKNRFVNNTMSAAKLVKLFMENLLDIRMENLDDFSEAVNDYDLWINKNPNGWCLNELYYKYWDERFRRRFSNGSLEYRPDEIAYIKDRRKEYKKLYESLELFELDDVNACFIISKTFINDLCHDLMEKEGYDIVFCSNANGNCSIRSKRKDIHIGEILESMGIGGGHQFSGGFRESDVSQFKSKIDDICVNIERKKKAKCV